MTANRCPVGTRRASGRRLSTAETTRAKVIVLDAAVGPGATTPGFRALCNVGDGRFRAARDVPGPVQLHEVRIADLDGDGHGDVIATSNRSDLLGSHGDGAFGFGPVTPFDAGAEPSTSRSATASTR